MARARRTVPPGMLLPPPRPPPTLARPIFGRLPPARHALTRIAVTGANSSVGRTLLTHVASRPELSAVACVRSTRALGELPDVDGVEAHIAQYDDPTALRASFEGCRAVVHLAGILVETRHTRYEAANVGTARIAAEAAAAAGVPHVVLISVLGADASSGNPYFRSKGRAEDAVAAAGVAATHLRTPILLGPGSAGAAALQRAVASGRAALLGGGSYRLRPLDLDDLATATLDVATSEATGVRVHELVGPEEVTYRDLVLRCAARAGAEVRLRSTPIALAKLGAAVVVITTSELVDENAADLLGLRLTPLDATLDKIFPSRDSTG